MARSAAIVLWLLGQGALILTAGTRPDRAGGFRMFEQSSTMQLHVVRVLRSGGEVPIVDGVWRARDCAGRAHEFDWHGLVGASEAARLDGPRNAFYGVAAAEERSRAALRYVLAHLPLDCETIALKAELSLERNGHPPSLVRFEERRL